MGFHIKKIELMKKTGFLFLLLSFFMISKSVYAMGQQECIDAGHFWSEDSYQCLVKSGSNAGSVVEDVEKAYIMYEGKRILVALDSSEYNEFVDNCKGTVSLYGDGSDDLTSSAVCITTKNECFYPDNPQEFVDGLASQCWYCGIFNQIIMTIQSIAMDVYKNINSGVIKLLAICFCVWLVIKVIGFIAVSHYQDQSQFYAEIGIGFFRLLVAYLALFMGTEIWDYIVGPMTSMTFDYSNVALNASMHGSLEYTDATLNSVSSSESRDPISLISSKIVGNGITAGGVIAKINEHLMRLIGSGIVLMTAAMKSGVFCLPIYDMMLFVTGLILVIFALSLLLSIPFMFADLCFRLGIFLVLLPVFIFTWTFTSLRFITGNGVSLLLHSMLILLMTSITVALCTIMLMTELQLPSFLDGFNENIEALRIYYNLGLDNLIVSVVIVLFSLRIIRLVPDIVSRTVPNVAAGNSQFSSGGGEAAVKNVITSAATTGSLAGKIATKGAKKGFNKYSSK